ncbi:uncharacterized protein LOC133205231 isoform X2 [Saccostrea echinata]|uniref:uncharacterized protein LOC133205231 isoform X2 n=1 Tax=Saccostrea echinata TaxID=191078 RepID=UPI002A802CEB|nr:uncharacterized protein LOC133205231 isoform X2 [Saccostrea echinata]
MDIIRGLGLILVLTVSYVLSSTTESTEYSSSTTQPSPTVPQNSSDENGTELSQEGVYVRVLGQSGKILMGRTRNPAEDPNGLKVTFDAIQETDKSGNAIGTSGRVKHSFNTFASQKFTVSNITEDQYQNLTARRLDFNASLASVGATLTVQIYLFSEEGNITQGDEVTQVSKGTLKFNIIIQNWSFCGTNGEECKKGQTTYDGEFIDFTISIKGKKSASKKDGRKKRTNAQEFDLGGEASVVLSGKARYDDSSNYDNLPEGFPKTITKGSSQFFVFRFKKFNSSVFYDPQLNLEGNDTSEGSPTETPSSEGTVSAAQITTKILGRSGKMTIGQGVDPSRDGNRVQVTFDEVKEISSTGSPVGTNGAQKHSFNTFASLDFTFSSTEDVTYMGLSAKRLNFTANIVSVGATLTVQVYIFTKDGEIDVDGETTKVASGTVKFNIKIDNWQFCGSNGVTCKAGNINEVGSAIEFTISIKGKGTGQKKMENKRTDGEEYDLGGGAAVLLSRKIQIYSKNTYGIIQKSSWASLLSFLKVILMLVLFSSVTCLTLIIIF